MVLLLPAREEVPEQHQAQQGHRLRVLEGHRHRPPHLLRHQLRRVHRPQEVPRVLPRQRRQGHQDRLDDARVPPPAGRRRQFLPEHARSCKLRSMLVYTLFNSHQFTKIFPARQCHQETSTNFHVCEITSHGALPHVRRGRARKFRRT